jgi:hypothetical protein
MKRTALFLILFLGIVAGLRASGTQARLDDGLLDPSWFGVPDGWRKADGIDYLWVKPGLDLNGRKIRLAPWSAPISLNGERDNADSKLALRLTDSMPQRLERALAPAFEDYAAVSRQEGDVLLTGRIVDCNAGVRALRWAIGSDVTVANATWDVKLVDAATGETLAAIHHRGVSGADSRTLGEKMDLWLTRTFAPALRENLEVYGVGVLAME